MENFLLCNGDKTQKSQKPLLNAIFVFGGLSECYAQQKFEIFYFAICHNNNIKYFAP